MKPVLIHSKAQAELGEAVAYYESQKQALGLDFQSEVERAADSDTNDMWIEVDFLEPTFEVAVLDYVKALLGRRYSPLASAPCETHCG